MPVSRAFLKPVTVEPLPQGDFEYGPVVNVYESDTAQGLEDLMAGAATTNAQATDWFWVIESVQYQVVVTKPAVGNNPAEMLYSALVWATQVRKV